MHAIRYFGASVAFLLALGSVATAQCGPTWLVPSGLTADGDVHCAVQWDPDAAGPLGPHLVVGGAFTFVGGVRTNGLALVDLATRTVMAFGSGPDGTVRSLAVGNSNELYIGGAFTAVDGVAASGVACHLGGVWWACGSGVDVASGGPTTMLVRANGELVVGGRFGTAGGFAVANVASWDGSAWSGLGGGLTAYDQLAALGSPGGVRELLDAPTGVVALGLFDAVGATPVHTVANWNGSSWQEVPGFAGASFVLSIDGCVLPNGELWVCGSSIFGGFLRSWNGVAWTELTGPANAVSMLAMAASGDVVAASNIGLGQVAVHRWRSFAWQQVGSMSGGPLTAKALVVAPVPALAADGFVVGGSQLTHMSGVNAASLLLHDDGNGWEGSSTVFRSARPRLCLGVDGEAYVLGAGSIGTTPLPGIGRWNGSDWVPVSGGPADIRAMTADPRGGFVAATTSALFRHDGAGWSLIAAGGANSPDQLAVLDDGSIVVANSFSPGRVWNGSWQNLGAAPIRIALHPDGRLVGSGFPSSFPFGARVGAYRDGIWTNLDPNGFVDQVPNAVAVLPNGDIVVGGAFASGNGVIVYDGTTWQSLGGNFDRAVTGLAVLADGSLVASGPFSVVGTVACNGLATWNGTAWAPVPGAPVDGSSSILLDLAAHPDGDLWAITATRQLARWASPCAAIAQATASSCTGPNQSAWLSSTAWPLLGGECRSAAGGLPPSAFAVGVFGASVPSLPLAVLLPFADAGCDLHVSADVVVAVASTTGTARFQFPVPVAPALVGLGLAQQVVVLGLQPAGIVSASSTNSLAFVVGSRL